MARCGAEAPITVQAGQDEIDHPLFGECFRPTKEMRGCEAPIQAVQTQMLREPVLKLIAPLQSLELNFVR